MNIGINFYMGDAQREGIGWSIAQLLQELLRPGSPHQFTVFTNLSPEAVGAEFRRPRNLSVVSFEKSIYTIWEQVGLPRQIRKAKVEIFHSPSGLPILCRTPGIATVHDLCFLTHPDTYTRRMRIYFRVFLPLSFRRARIVLAVSEASKRALIERLRVPERKIRVVPNGVSEDFRPESDAAVLRRVRERYGLPESFILYVGTLQPRKNLLTLLKACQHLWNTDRVKDRLVIVGKRGWLSEEFLEFVEGTGLRDQVLFTGYIPRDDLPAVYSAAKVFVYPSLCEGFGLPPLEAMACGTPVVASNSTALPEVLGSAGRLVDPGDPESLAEAIRELLEDERLRDSFRARGLERARLYRWGEAARKVLSVYDEVAGHAG